MRDLLGLAIDVAAIGVGLFFIGYTLWRIYVSRQRAAAMSPRAARIWRWRIVLGLCWGSIGIFFGSIKLLQHLGVGGFEWLIIPGLFAAVGFVVAMLMLGDLGDLGHAQRRERGDDTG